VRNIHYIFFANVLSLAGDHNSRGSDNGGGVIAGAMIRKTAAATAVAA
jgi:hypothetical protein